jgi:hypothetical protein
MSAQAPAFSTRRIAAANSGDVTAGDSPVDTSCTGHVENVREMFY